MDVFVITNPKHIRLSITQFNASIVLLHFGPAIHLVNFALFVDGNFERDSNVTQHKAMNL